MLENEGNQVSLATNGQEACEAYEAAVERGEPFEVTRSRSRSRTPNPEPRTPNPEPRTPKPKPKPKPNPGPKVIFMDCNMPVLDGYEATKKIRKMQAERDRILGDGGVPVVALTAYAMPGDKEKCLNAGMDDYITKPLNKDVLLSTLAKHLKEGRRRAAEAASQRGGDRDRPPGGQVAQHRSSGESRRRSSGAAGGGGEGRAAAAGGNAHARRESLQERSNNAAADKRGDKERGGRDDSGAKEHDPQGGLRSPGKRGAHGGDNQRHGGGAERRGGRERDRASTLSDEALPEAFVDEAEANHWSREAARTNFNHFGGTGGAAPPTYIVLATSCLLLTTHYSLLATCYSPLTTHHSPLITHSWLRTDQ
jgi:CheY-like chemotaxis protein